MQLSLLNLIAIILITVLATLLLVWLVNRLMDLLKKRRENQRPVIRICSHNGKLGVVLRSDYEKASAKRFPWRPLLGTLSELESGELGEIYMVEVSPVFVFADLPEVRNTLLTVCSCERATFFIPPHQPYASLREALTYFKNQKREVE